MIVVVEGPSAAGKTTWSVAHGSDSVVAENERVDLPADLSAAELAEFWNDVNCRRWAEAVRAETASGMAVCDTDPFKLHYAYCLARIGAAPWDRFDVGVDVAADAIASRRLGIADIVLVSIPSDTALAHRRNSDLTRARTNFELHRRLGEGLHDWYGALDQLDPGRVSWEHPQALPTPVRRDRHSVDLFRAWMAQLPRQATSRN